MIPRQGSHPTSPQPTAWEAAYLGFETPEREIRKFRRRLAKVGAHRWPRDARIVEICCGRGSGLRALGALGFTNIVGLDLSRTFVDRYTGPGTVVRGDCRDMPFANDSCDIVMVQGGLHHLPVLPDDLQKTLSEALRVLRSNGCFVAIEPWLTPFLRLVHAVCRVNRVRSVSRAIDALATMIELERETYERWLNSPDEILAVLSASVEIVRCDVRWGKLIVVGRKKLSRATSTSERRR